MDTETLNDLPEGKWTDRQRRLASIREMLDFLESHPDFPIPYGMSYVSLFADTKEEIVNMVKQLGDVTKHAFDDQYTVEKRFGTRAGITIYISRDQVCRKVVTGIERVEEIVTPAHDKEIVDWICDEPLLKLPEDADAG